MQLVSEPAPAVPRPVPPLAAEAEAPRSGIARALARGALRACHVPDNLPLAFRNASGDLVGYDVELAHLLARELGVALELVEALPAEIPVRLARGDCDLAAASYAVTTLRAREVAFAEPHLQGTLAFVVKDHRRDEFSTREAVQRLRRPRLGIPNMPYYIDMVRSYLPAAELELVPRPRDFFESRGEELDGYVFAAEMGAAWTLLYPGYSVVVPQPDVVAIPMAWPAARHDLETAHFLGTWFALKRASGTLDRLRDRWILGRGAVAHRPRWSVLRDVLGWRDASAGEPGPERGRALGSGE
jgi:hypothetical protein